MNSTCSSLSFEKQLGAFAKKMAWRAQGHSPSPEEVGLLGLSESQANQLDKFIERGDWRDEKAIELLGAELRALVKKSEGALDS